MIKTGIRDSHDMKIICDSINKLEERVERIERFLDKFAGVDEK